jgi:hypothetical protein
MTIFVTTRDIWTKEARAVRCLNAAMAILAVIASQVDSIPQRLPVLEP